MKVRLIKIVDRIVGGLILVILSPFGRKRKLENREFKNILLIQLWGIGETILHVLIVIVQIEQLHNYLQ